MASRIRLWCFGMMQKNTNYPAIFNLSGAMANR
jgi:hypothetical protein